VLDRFKKYNLKLKPKKCNLFQNKIKFLGKIISAEGININPENVVTVKNWPVPKSKKDVESFLGFMNYHREHIHGFAKIGLPLHEVVRPKEPFVWHEEQQNIFERLRTTLVEPVKLNYPNSNDTFFLDTEAIL
jgi:hypothetical protein